MRPRGPRPIFWVLLVHAALVTVVRPALAQSCGGSAGPSLAGSAATEGSWLGRGQGAVRLSEEYEVKDRSYKGAHRVPNDFHESLFISRSALDLRYGATDDWTAELTATYPHFTYRLKPPGGERLDRRFRGPGDTFLWIGRKFDLGAKSSACDAPASDAASGASSGAAFSGFPSATTDAAPSPPFLSLWAGASLPTGSAEKPNPAFVTRDVSVANLQTGTGTLDPLARARIEWPATRWTAFVEADVRYPLYENRYGYRTADTEAVAAGASTPIVSKLTGGLALIFQRTGRDLFRGKDVGVGGARWLYVAPGVTFQLTDAVALDLGCRVPIYRRTQTKLSDSSVVWQAGVSFSF